MVTKNKKHLTEKIIKNNSKEHPIDLDIFSKEEVYCYYIDNKKSLYTKGHCESCEKFFTRHLRYSTKYVDIGLCRTCSIKKTNFIRYGVESYTQTKTFQEKSKETNLRKYGVENVNQLDFVKNIKKQKSLERYGTNCVLQAREVQEKIKNTNLEKYGFYNPSKSDIVKEHTKQNNLEKYGVEYPNMLDEYKDKHVAQWKETMLETYGTTKVNISKYLYNDLYFDSSWELAFYIYHKDKGHKIEREPCHFEYIDSTGKTHEYFPDFKVGNRYYEIKGDHYIEFYKNGKPKTLKDNPDKYKCMKKHKVVLIWSKQIIKYITYIFKVYGQDYFNEFKL